MAEECSQNYQRRAFSSPKAKTLLRLAGLSFALPFLLSFSGCIVRGESSDLILKGSTAESAEVVNLDPVFLSRQRKAEAEFFGFDSTVVTDMGRIPVSRDDDEEGDTPESAETNAAVNSLARDHAANSLNYAWPVEGSISSPFGMRHGRLHAGIDIRAPRGTPIRAAADGQVLSAKRHGTYGNAVIIGHDNDHQTLYAHMLRIVAKEGAYVHAGDLLGYVGRTGHATGYHLHFETHVAGGIPQDPMRFLPGGKSTKVGMRVPGPFAGM